MMQGNFSFLCGSLGDKSNSKQVDLNQTEKILYSKDNDKNKKGNLRVGSRYFYTICLIKGQYPNNTSVL